MCRGFKSLPRYQINPTSTGATNDILPDEFVEAPLDLDIEAGAWTGRMDRHRLDQVSKRLAGLDAIGAGLYVPIHYPNQPISVAPVVGERPHLHRDELGLVTDQIELTIDRL
ncbi:hypothetical protein [Methylobacterium fujisawaense]|uniref:hypothetical protein n=1 Tax=Methylobacterium fujisawaense TaxID=107400 RepID=UPI002F3510E5